MVNRAVELVRGQLQSSRLRQVAKVKQQSRTNPPAALYQGFNAEKGQGVLQFPGGGTFLANPGTNGLLEQNRVVRLRGKGYDQMPRARFKEPITVAKQRSVLSVLVVDCSGSTAGGRQTLFGHFFDFVKYLASKQSISFTGAVAYSDIDIGEEPIIFSITPSRQFLKEKRQEIENISFGGGDFPETTIDGLIRAIDLIKGRKADEKVCILYTDASTKDITRISELSRRFTHLLALCPLQYYQPLITAKKIAKKEKWLEDSSALDDLVIAEELSL